MSWKIAEMTNALPNSDDAGEVVVLVWEVIDCGLALPSQERCLVLKRYRKPTAAGHTCVFGFLDRTPTAKEPVWKPAAYYKTVLTPDMETTLVEISAISESKTLPTDAEIALFLKQHRWERRLEPGETTVFSAEGRTIEKYVPKVTDGGICRTVWKKAFDRDPPTKLFPELLITPPTDKK